MNSQFTRLMRCPGCRREFRDEGGYQRHTQSCAGYQNVQDSLVQRSRGALQGGLRSRLKRRREEEDVEPQPLVATVLAGPSRPSDYNIEAVEEHGGSDAAVLPILADEGPTDLAIGGLAADSHGASVSPTSPTTPAGRPVRSNRNRLPARYRDVVAEPPAPIQGGSPFIAPATLLHQEELEIEGSAAGPSTVSAPLGPVRTPPNTFGILREYYGALPLVDPIGAASLQDLVVVQGSEDAQEVEDPLPAPAPMTPYGPYPNRSAYLLGQWFWNESVTKSVVDLDHLVNDVILDPHFVPADVRGVKWGKVHSQLGSSEPSQFFSSQDGWIQASVTIQVPFGKKNLPPQPFTVPGLFYRPIEAVIQNVFGHTSARGFHYEPFKMFWQPGDSDTPEQRIYGEIFTSDAFAEAHQAIQDSLPEPECSLPRAVAACMLWSDSTHLADFGSASMWPSYLMFGNQSKYERGEPNSHSCHHIAYFPKLADDLRDFIEKHSGSVAPAPLLTHCHRELMHAIWKLILGDKFEHACRHGIVVTCADGIRRRLYPRLFTYSADYPEKVLLATVRNMGACPCPRCLVNKADIYQLGMVRDMQRRETHKREDDHERRWNVASAQRYIHRQGYGVTSTAVEALLKAKSWVPTENAFSGRLAASTNNFHDLFVPDSLHEWDLGVWKNLLIHLLRLLQSVGASATHTFDSRFRLITPFGRDTIRKFDANVSEMKKLAARNFEDILQCCIPVFEGLFPAPHDRIVQELLFTTAYLQGLHKLRMHTDYTLSVAESVLVDFGNQLRYFKRFTCAAFLTTELPKEKAARARRQAKGSKGKSQASQSVPEVSAQLSTDKGKGREQGEATSNQAGGGKAGAGAGVKEYNMNTYKLHSLGDYVKTIRRLGTTDSYTTQIGECEHRRVKRRYMRTSKKEFVAQVADIERREARLRDMSMHLMGSGLQPGHARPQPKNFKKARPHQHYYIGESQKEHFHLPSWLCRHHGDPAIKDFYPKLKDHMLARIRGLPLGEEIIWPDEQRNQILFKDDRIYMHRTLRINYTTYDIRRDQEVVNPGTDRRDVMVLANNDDRTAHPFWYARVLGIYHAQVLDTTGGRDAVPQRIEFLYVRWFGEEPEWQSGWQAQHLDRIGFIPQDDDGAFGFLDPHDVLRACHLIPAFHIGRTTKLLATSVIARRPEESDDWDSFYVNRFVDRDMLMRYVGFGIGHAKLPVHRSHPLFTQRHVHEISSNSLEANPIAMPQEQIREQVPTVLSDGEDEDTEPESDLGSESPDDEDDFADL